MKKSPVSSINYIVAVAILSALMDVDLMNMAKHELMEQGKPCELFRVRRYVLSEVFELEGTTPVYADAWKTMLKIRKVLSNPDDLGKDGKFAEVRDRIELFEMNGQSKTTWSEFFAHKSGKKDIVDKVEKLNIEKKTSVGDWHTSKRAKTLDQMRRELERKTNDIIRWDCVKTIVKPASKRKPERAFECAVHWEKTWTEFFATLELFNGSIETWFKPIIKKGEGKNTTYILQMQEITTSEKKMRFLMEHNDK